jgi:exonuclease SbcD
MLDPAGAHIRGGYRSIGEVLHLNCSDGPLDVVPLPYLDPQASPDDFAVPAGLKAQDSSGATFERRLRRTHQFVLEEAVRAAGANRMVRRSLAVAHAYVVGGLQSDSERDLAMGGTGAVDARVFDGFSYVALGHLHRPQGLEGREHVRYAGSPLAYSFSEEQPKSVVLVDMARDGSCRAVEVPIPVGRGVHTVEGLMEDLLARKPSPAVEASFVRAIVTDPGVVLDARQRLSAVYPHVVEIELRPAVQGGAHGAAVIELSKTSAMAAIEAFWLDSLGELPTEGERTLLEQAIAAVQREEHA